MQKRESDARFGKLWWWVFDSSEFTTTEKLTFAALSLYQDNQKSCYPSIAELARVSSLGKSTIKRDVRKLEEKGAIRHKKRFNKNGQTSNMYHIAESPPHRPTKQTRGSMTQTSGIHHIDTPHPPRGHEQIYITDLINREGGVPQKTVIYKGAEIDVVEKSSPLRDFEEATKTIILELEEKKEDKQWSMATLMHSKLCGNIFPKFMAKQCPEKSQ